jgi:hypothetical protein
MNWATSCLCSRVVLQEAPEGRSSNLSWAGTGRLSSRSWEGRGPAGRDLSCRALPDPAERRPEAWVTRYAIKFSPAAAGRATGVGLGARAGERGRLAPGGAPFAHHLDASFGDVSMSSDADRQRLNLMLALPCLEPGRNVVGWKWRTEQEPLG